MFFGSVHNQPYSFFHEQNFRLNFSNGLLPDYLQFAVIASALRFSDDPYYEGRIFEATAAYALESWKRIVSAWFATESDPNIHVCQAIALLSIIDFTGTPLAHLLHHFSNK